MAIGRERIVNRDLNPRLATLPSWMSGFRGHQTKAIIEIAAAFEDVDMVVLEAPTGAGKTLVAETVRRMMGDGERGPGHDGIQARYVATSKSLQEQFARDYDYAKVIKGRGNYPTANFPSRFNPSNFAGNLSCDDCDWSTAKLECSWCGRKGNCPYEIAKSSALRADVSVLNTAYFLAEANTAAKFSGNELVIVDEADTLEHSLMDYVSVDIGRRRMAKYGWEPPEKVTVAASWVEWLEVHIPRAQKLLAEAQIALSRASGEGLRERREVRVLEGMIASLRLVAKGLAEGKPWVYTGEGGQRDRGDGAKAVSFKPTMVDELGDGYLWRHSRKWLLMSATVISAEEMLDSLGWKKEFRVIRVPSTFPPENRTVIPLCTVNVSNKTGEAGRRELARQVRWLVERHPSEKILVHTVSYDITRMVVEELRGVRGRKVFSYTRAEERERALERYKASTAGVLVAPSMDRGVDLPGDLCRVQIIAKIPFPYLGDRRVSARLHSRGGQVWYNVQTVRTLVQMTGRGVRDKHDACVSYILDQQFQSMVWSRSRSLLPAWWVEAVDWRQASYMKAEMEGRVRPEVTV